MKFYLLLLSWIFISFQFNTKSQSYDFDLLLNVNGSRDSNPNNLTVSNDLLFFTAETFGQGRELWVTDGTEVGTKLVKDINPEGDSNPYMLTPYNNKLYFSADDDEHGRELWVSDGTEEGTKMVIDINKGDDGSVYSYDSKFTIFNNKLILVSPLLNNGEILGIDLWESDGTEEGTNALDVLNFIAFKDSDFPNNFTEYNGNLFFSANGELYITDGTSENSGLFKDIKSGPGKSSPEDFTLYKNKLFFSAEDSDNGREIWVTDGTSSGTELYKDLDKENGSFPQELTVSQNRLYFVAGTGDYIDQLWVSEGNSSDVKQVIDVNQNGNGRIQSLTHFNQNLYFVGYDPNNIWSIWVAGGDNAILFDIESSEGGKPRKLTVIDNYMFFISDDGTNGDELFVTDGTFGNTEKLTPDIALENPLGETEEFVKYKNAIYFSAAYTDNGRELWRIFEEGVSVEEEHDSNKVFPNPVDNVLNLETNFGGRLHVIDVNGKLVRTVSKDKIRIDVSKLTPGKYFILDSENQVVESFIKK